MLPAQLLMGHENQILHLIIQYNSRFITYSFPLAKRFFKNWFRDNDKLAAISSIV